MFKKKIFLIFFFLIFLIFLFLFFYNQVEKKNRITFLDTGQGSSVLIQSKNSENILVDTGNEKKSLKSLSKKLGFFNRKIDVIFISHYDLDHVGLLPFYLDNYNVSMVIDSGITKVEDSQKVIFDEIQKTIKEKNIKYLKLSKGDEVILNESLKIKVLFPEKFLDLSKMKSNSTSLVLKIFMDGKEILLTGDLPEKFENLLVQTYRDDLGADILLAGHHGSKTSSGELFLKTVKPENFIISSGKGNSYGHPHKEVLERAKKLNFNILRTDILGSVSF